MPCDMLEILNLLGNMNLRPTYTPKFTRTYEHIVNKRPPLSPALLSIHFPELLLALTFNARSWRRDVSKCWYRIAAHIPDQMLVPECAHLYYLVPVFQRRLRDAVTSPKCRRDGISIEGVAWGAVRRHLTWHKCRTLCLSSVWAWNDSVLSLANTIITSS